MCEFPYEFELGNSRSRFTLTTAQTDAELGYASLPRLGSAKAALQSGYNTDGFKRGGAFGRGASAGPLRPQAVIR